MQARVRDAGPQLTGAERRVAAVVLERPQLVGFGTVADLAEAAGAGAATVVRLAAKLGFDGFSALQASIQRDLAHQLRPAAERIRELAGDQPISRHRSAELSNVQATLDAVDPATLDAVVGLLADTDREVLVLAGDAERGVAIQFATDLASLRPGVVTISGSDVTVRRQLATTVPDSTLLVIDLRRYERWLLDAFAQGKDAGHTIVALTDGCCRRWRWGHTTRSRSLRDPSRPSTATSARSPCAICSWPRPPNASRTPQRTGCSASRPPGPRRDRSPIPDQPGEQGSEVGDGRAREIGDRVPGDGVALDAQRCRRIADEPVAEEPVQVGGTALVAGNAVQRERDGVWVDGVEDEAGLLGELPRRRLARRLAGLDVTAGAAPPERAVVDEEDLPAFGVEHPGDGGELPAAPSRCRRATTSPTPPDRRRG